jgi:hypothetical protein
MIEELQKLNQTFVGYDAMAREMLARLQHREKQMDQIWISAKFALTKLYDVQSRLKDNKDAQTDLKMIISDIEHLCKIMLTDPVGEIPQKDEPAQDKPQLP